MGPSIVEVDSQMTAYKEEIFGPVLCIVKVNSIDEGIYLKIRNRIY